MNTEQIKTINELSETLKQMDALLQKLMPDNALEQEIKRQRIDEVKEYFITVQHSDLMKVPPILLEDRCIEDIYRAFQEVYASELQARSCEYYQNNGVYTIRTFGSLD